MNSLSNEQLYTQDEIVSAVMSAGQFVHASRLEITGALDRLFDNPAGEDTAGAVLLKAHRKGYPKLYEPYYAIGGLEDRIGLVCCLCAEVYKGQRHFNISEDFHQYICPSYLFVKYTDEEQPEGDGVFSSSLPICEYCWNPLYISRKRKWRDVPGSELWNLILSQYLLSTQSFRDRVKNNAPKWKTFRFDPRRAERIAA